MIEGYNSITLNYGWKDTEPTQAHDYLFPALVHCLPTGKLRIIDVGSGNGYVAGRLSELGHEVVGIEPSADGIDLARERYPHIQFANQSIYDDFDWENSYRNVDVVLAVEVIEHLYQPRVLFHRAYQMLKPGGILVVTTPYHGYLKNLVISFLNRWDNHFKVAWDGGHIKFFSKKTLSKMIKEADFRDCCFHYVGRFYLLWKSMICEAIRP
jgi:2-polyprenyl-3-methyl-5-hydroxy-6-metoxy-1,4-benzoquinol methylase